MLEVDFPPKERVLSSHQDVVGRVLQRVPFIDLRQQHRSLGPQLVAALRQVFDTSDFIMGPNVRALEEEIAGFCGLKHAMGVGSGTDALMLSLRALGIGVGDEVLVPSFVYTATAAAVRHAGATPVFVDSLPDGFNLDPADAARRVTSNTRAIIPVHLYGEAAPMAEVLELARAHNLRVVEDVAQAMGGQWRGQRLGSLGDVGCFSFYPTKNLPACGDGGLVTTDDDQLAEQIRLLRQQGDASALGGEKYRHPTVGFNSRLDEMQAAILRVKLPHLDSWNRRRIEHATHYQELLAGSGVRLPAASTDGSHVYDLYTIGCDRRDELRRHLAERGIGSGIYYPLPLHLQEAYREVVDPDEKLPVAERLAKEVLSLPIYPELEEAQVVRVAEAVLEFSGKAG